MPVTPEFRARAEMALGSIVQVQTRPMFGGVGVYSNGLFFALMDDDRVYFKVDDSNRQDFQQLGSGPFRPPGMAPMKGYYELPEGLLASPRELAVWIDKSLLVAARAAERKRK